MNRGILILLFTISQNLNLLAQDFTKLNEIKLSDSLSCSQAQKKVIECCNYLFSNPCIENSADASVIKFIVDWMGATPDFSFATEENFLNVIKPDMYLSGRYFASLAKTAIEKNYSENSIVLQIIAINAVLDYCESPENKVRISDEIQEYIDAKKAGSLKEFISNRSNFIRDQDKIDQNLIEILRKHPHYSDTDYSSIPEITYQPDSCTDLIKLRMKYKLDSIAGSGDEFDKQKNLLMWVNRFIKLSGNVTARSPTSSTRIWRLGC